MTTLTREKTETASEPIDRRVLVAKLAALEQAEAAENEADRKTWREIVIRFTDTGECDISELRRLNRSTAELQAASDLLTQRREWAAEFALKAAREQTIKAASLQRQALATELQEVLRSFEMRELEIAGRQDEARRQLDKSLAGYHDLVETCRDPESLAALARLAGRVDEIGREQADLQHRITVKTNARQSWIETEDVGYQSDIDRVAAELEQMQQQLIDLSSEAMAINDVQHPQAQLAPCVPEKF